jgi:hypothetical protein
VPTTSNSSKKETGQVPIRPKVSTIGLQIFVIGAFYIIVTLNQYNLVRQVFGNHFEPTFEEYF